MFDVKKARILLLGAGMQGLATLHDLCNSPDVSRVTAVDIDVSPLQEYLSKLPSDKVRVIRADARDQSALSDLLGAEKAIVVALLPRSFHIPLIRTAINNGVNLVTANSLVNPAELDCSKVEATKAEIAKLHEEAVEKGVTILPEFGMEPGIDLVLAGQAVRELNEVHELYLYTESFPQSQELSTIDGDAIISPFKGRLKSYFRPGRTLHYRPARILQDGHVIDIPAEEVFTPAQNHMIHLEGVGALEAYPNGNSMHYANLLGIRGTVRSVGRFALRWPGHCEFWRTLVKLKFLDEKAIQVKTKSVVPRECLTALLESQAMYSKDEGDIAVVRVDARGIKDGKRRRVIYQVIDRTDTLTGYTALARTTGFTASIGAQMIHRGLIKKRGILSPARDIPFPQFSDELEKRRIYVAHSVQPW